MCALFSQLCIILCFIYCWLLFVVIIWIFWTTCHLPCGYVDVWHSATEAVVLGYVITRPRETQSAATLSAAVIHVCCETSAVWYCAVKVTYTTKWDDRYIWRVVICRHYYTSCLLLLLVINVICRHQICHYVCFCYLYLSSLLSVVATC